MVKAMPPARLATIGEALYGPRWQSALARLLGVDDRTVRRWLAADRAIPEGAAEVLERLAKADEWINGEGAASGAEYIVHTRWPRFVARVVVEDEGLPGDAGADTIGGLTYSGEGGLLCEIVWHDPPPEGRALRELLRRADDALIAAASG